MYSWGVNRVIPCYSRAPAAPSALRPAPAPGHRRGVHPARLAFRPTTRSARLRLGDSGSEPRRTPSHPPLRLPPPPAPSHGAAAPHANGRNGRRDSRPRPGVTAGAAQDGGRRQRRGAAAQAQAPFAARGRTPPPAAAAAAFGGRRDGRWVVPGARGSRRERRGAERSQAVRGGRCDRNGRAGSGDKQRCPCGGSGEGGRALLTVGVRGLLGKGARCPAGGMLVACSRPASLGCRLPTASWV